MNSAPQPSSRRRGARPGAEGILAAALAAFYEIGYGGTTVRMIAARSQVTVAALYHHFPSKQAILVTVMRNVMDTVIHNAGVELADCPPDPAAQLGALVGAHIRYHAEHRAEAFVASSELRSLQPRSHKQIVALRDRYEGLFLDAVESGCRQGVFRTGDPKQATRAIVAMCGAVATWYQPGGPLTPEDLEAQYIELALHMVGYEPPAARATGLGPRAARTPSARSAAGHKSSHAGRGRRTAR